MPSACVREACPDDIRDMLAVYAAVEHRSPGEPMDGWTPRQVQRQLADWIAHPERAVCLVSAVDQILTGFTVALIQSVDLATLEIFVTDPTHRRDFRMKGPTAHSGELLFRSICDRLRNRGIETVNTLVNTHYYDFRRHVRFLRFRGFRETAHLVEFEFELNPD